MKFTDRKPAVLLLEDGSVFHGYAAGKEGTSYGEICFNTGMTGYQEIYTDPSYFGQIMVNTTAHVGNYGVHAEEIESGSPKIAGLVVRNFSDTFSRHTPAFSLKEYLEQNNIVAISDVDTRMLVRHIRNKGAMNAIISTEILDADELKNKLKKCPPMNGLELSTKVTCKESYYYGNPKGKFRVSALDYGIKKNILRNFDGRDCYVKIFPAQSSFETIMEFEPDGIFLSNGPGDPAAMLYAVEMTKKVLQQNIPLFGICLGHQILALTCGVNTFKMFNGHRGCNHPVKNLITGKCEVTSQNHGFGVIPEEVQKNKDVVPTHINLNDNSIEGIAHKHKPAFSVQYHPESSPGPHDSRYLFDDFMRMIDENKKSSVSLNGKKVKRKVSVQ